MNIAWRMILVGGIAFGFTMNAQAMITSYEEAKKEIAKYEKNRDAYLTDIENKFAADKKIPRESRSNNKYKQCIDDMIAVKMASARKTVSFYDKRGCSVEEYNKELRISNELFKIIIDIIVKKYGP